MANLPNIQKLTGVQKIFAFVLLGAAALGAIKLFNMFVAPHLLLFTKNIWLLLVTGGPLVLIALYVISNPFVIWGFFRTLSWKLTSWLIKQDPLSVMDRYVEYLEKKLKNLGLTINVLAGKKIKLDRNVNELQGKLESNLRLGNAAKIQNKTNEASTYGVKVSTDKSTLKTLMPLQARATKSLDFLKALSENWQFSIEKLKYQIEGKRTEYEIIKETTKGLKSAEDMINSDNEAARIYGMGLKELEEQVTQKMGYMEEFERKSKGAMSNISIEKQAMMDEGLAELEKYMDDGSLMLPDFSKLNGTNVEYEIVPGASKQLVDTFKFD